MNSSARLSRSRLRSRSLALCAIASLSLVGLAGCSDDAKKSDTATDAASSASSATCEYPASGEAAKQVDPPSGTPELADAVAVTAKTSVGDLNLDLNAKAAPCTVNSFVSLAEQGYFNDTSCHRLTTSGIFVLQCGDPTASSMGGPGYTIPDEFTGSETYPAGTLAMANTGQPGSGGSQFFMVYKDTSLPPTYTVFGTMDASSIAVLQKVAAKGTETGSPDGPPKAKVTLNSVEVR